MGKLRAAVEAAMHYLEEEGPDTPLARERARALREALPELDEMVSMQAASGMVHVARMTERARREQADRDWAAGC